MKVTVNKKFAKDLSRIPSSERKRIEKLVFEDAEKFKSIEAAGIFEKLKGYKIYYRARFGDYRVGVRYEHEELVFERVLNRKEMYRQFP